MREHKQPITLKPFILEVNQVTSSKILCILSMSYQVNGVLQKNAPEQGFQYVF